MKKQHIYIIKYTIMVEWYQKIWKKSIKNKICFLNKNMGVLYNEVQHLKKDKKHGKNKILNNLSQKLRKDSYHVT